MSFEIEALLWRDCTDPSHLISDGTLMMRPLRIADYRGFRIHAWLNSDYCVHPWPEYPPDWLAHVPGFSGALTWEERLGVTWTFAEHLCTESEPPGRSVKCCYFRRLQDVLPFVDKVHEMSRKEPTE